MWSVRERATFGDLRRRGRRFRDGPVSVSHLPGRSDEPARVAFAIGRRTGGAVVRNRLRRRLREVLAELDRQGQIPPGAYLVSVSPGAGSASFEELRSRMQRVMSQVREATP